MSHHGLSNAARPEERHGCHTPEADGVSLAGAPLAASLQGRIERAAASHRASAAAPIQREQVLCQAHQRPFGLDLRQAPQQKLAEPPRALDQDETNVEWTVPHLKQFMTDIATTSGAQTIHLIAHSMGNRALMAALREIAGDRKHAEKTMFKEVVLTAPDIDAEVFKRLAREISKTANRITLYASSNDEALALSKRFHGYPRAGDSGKTILVIPGVDTIDVSGVDTGLIGHFYYGENKSFLSDVFNLFKYGSRPDERFGLVTREQEGLRYWLFRP